MDKLFTSHYLANATGAGPFTAGVNQVIPFEAFGGDGKLTRLLLNGATSAPWSDNGTAGNAALLPVAGLPSGQYFYEVDLGGNLAGKTGQALLTQLLADGSQTATATLKVYAAGSNGQADTSTPVATKSNIQIQFAGLTSNVNTSLTVPAQYIANATAAGPFTAGVNQVIPFEAFGGDGMLTRLLLNSATNAPWSDNGTAKNAALLPIDNLASGRYFYEVDLSGDLAGKTGQALLDQLRADGMSSTTATVKVYAAGADGQADLSQVVAEQGGINIQFQGLTDNIQSAINVPASYLSNAKGDGPFTAGVNQVIPYEAFGGDGMLTRLLLDGAQQAPWSNNGTAKNAALLPVQGLATGEYFYEVDFPGNLAGKQGQALIDQLKQNGTMTYNTTVKLYAAGSDGQADTSRVIAQKDGMQITINVAKQSTTTTTGQTPTKSSQTPMTSTKKTSTQPMAAKSTMKRAGNATMKPMMQAKAKALPQTGDAQNQVLAVIGAALIAVLALIGTTFGVNRKRSVK